MKLFYLLLICVVSLAAMASAQQKLKIPPPDDKKNLPQLTGSGGGSRKDGFDINIDARQKVWESDNKRHSFDVTAGHSQHLGGPYGSSRPDHRVGAGYTFRF